MQTQILQCKHCHDDLLPDQTDFCCAGCQTVFKVLSKHNLDRYYKLREELVGAPTSVFPKPQISESDLPDAEVYLKEPTDFYLQGMHCAACVWLIEQLPFVMPEVETARVDLSTQKLYLTFSQPVAMAKIISLLAHWGYRATPLQQAQQHEELARKERRLMLLRIGVAAFSSGNLMILSLSFYAGLTGAMAFYFEILSLLLFLPVFGFSAWPFYKQGLFRLLKTGYVSADLPIALSLILGTVGSVYEMFWGNHQLYFDSLSMLVFLLLCSRYLLLRTQQRILGQAHPHFKLPVTHVIRKNLDGFTKVPVEHIVVGDTLRFFKDQTFVADGVIVEGHSRVDQSLLTGEPYPLKVAAGDTVFRGTINQQNAVEMQVTAINENTRLGKILATARHFSSQKSRWIRAAEKGARLLSAGVLLASGFLLALFWQQPQLAFSRFLALSIVACPCGLALATPLILHLSLRGALKSGLFIKHPNIIEAIPRLKKIVLDKTGTLTQGVFDVLWSSESFFSPEVAAAVLALESQSRHPVASAIVRYIQQHHPQAVVEVSDLQILVSGGISGNVLNANNERQNWQIRPAAYSSTTSQERPRLHLEIFCEETKRAEIHLGDALVSGVKETLNTLKQRGYELFLLSGDTRSACVSVAQSVGIPLSHVRWQQSPEDKAAFLQHEKAMMVGDGLNDLTALSCAEVGISVRGGLEENVKQCDVYLAEKGILQLPLLVEMASRTRRLLVFTLSFALLYNLLAISLAICGLITPLAAAILMPLSAFFVIALSVGGQTWKF